MTGWHDIRVLITGAGGFIGSHLARALHGKGIFVRAVDIKWDGFIGEPYYGQKLTLDLRNFENCLGVTRDIDYVFNLAANLGGVGYLSAAGAELMYDNVLINANMLQASVQNNVKRFFFPSSACVYPTYRQTESDAPALREEDAFPADPENFYGWEKLYMEKMCEAYKKDYRLDVRIARYGNIYGPEGIFQGGKEKSPAALCRKIAEASNPGVIEIWGDGKQTRSYCYIDDCLKGIVMLMESDYDKPLNISSDRLVTIDELADIIINISGKKIEKKYDHSAPQGVRGRNADLTLVKKVLNWVPQICLEEGLARTYKWIEKMVKTKWGT